MVKYTGKSPVYAGGLVEFDLCGSRDKPPHCELLSASKRRLVRDEKFKLNPYGMGLQVSCSLDSQIPPQCKLRQYLGDVLHELARQRESRIIEGDLCIDHIHMCIAIPPKHSVSEVVGFIKGKSAIAIARDVGGKARNFVGQSFWARGYYVSIVGRDEDMIREYIRNQEAEERRLEQISLLK